jgi:hypothetical protein
MQPMNESSRLPRGYLLDPLRDPSVIALLRPDGTLVARFTRFADPQEIRRAAEEDRAAGGRDVD